MLILGENLNITKMEIAKEIINSIQYQKIVDCIQKRTRLKILSEYRDAVAVRDEQKMGIANFSKADAMKLLEEDLEKFCRFTLYKMQKFEGTKIDEEFPDGEDPEIENDNEVILGYSRSFLLLYLIEYHLLKNNPEKLESYLKIIRIPNAKKYEKELRDIYSKL